MTSKQRREYWVRVERMRKAIERKYYPLIKDALDKQISSFTNAYEKDPAGAISEINLQVWNEDLLTVFYRLYKETYLLFASATFNQVRKENLKFNLMGNNETWTQEVLAWLARFGLNLVSTISGNSRDLLLGIVNQAIQEGVDEGLGVYEVTRNVLSRLRDENYTFTRFRAERIVRTETMRAANEGHMAGANALPFETKKIWISAHDGRTRRIPKDQYDHWDMDGREADLKEPFVTTGKQGQPVVAMQPGDVTAPLGFTINCRCRVAFEGKRDKDGRLIRKL
jgi:hypothetical protein